MNCKKSGHLTATYFPLMINLPWLFGRLPIETKFCFDCKYFLFDYFCFWLVPISPRSSILYVWQGSKYNSQTYQFPQVLLDSHTFCSTTMKPRISSQMSAVSLYLSLSINYSFNFIYKMVTNQYKIKRLERFFLFGGVFFPG